MQTMEDKKMSCQMTNPRAVRTALISVVAGALSLAAVTARATVIEDWSGGNDAAWTRVDVLQPPLGPALGGASYTVAGGAYTIASNQPLPAQVGAGSLWNPSFVDPTYANGFLRSVLRRNTGNENVALVMRFDAGTGSYYSFDLGGGVIGITRVVGFAAQDLVQLPFTTTAGVDFNAEAGAVGSSLTWKIWPVGDPEPPMPQVVWTDAAFTAGALGVAVNNFFNQAGPISGTFGAVSFEVPEPATGLLGLLTPLAWRRRRRGVRR